MDTLERMAYRAWIFRSVGMLVGLVVIYMGLRLFRRPHRDAGSMAAEYQGGKLTIQGAAGVFFVVLGTLIMAVALLKPITFDGKTTFVTPEGEVLEEDFRGAPAAGPPDSITAIPDSLRPADSASVR